MAKLVLNDITSGFASTTATNTNNGLIETAIENTLSRDGTSPNQMLANLDMNGYAILNQRATSGNENFIWMGTWVTGTAYVVNNLVYAPEGTNEGATLICVTAHTAGATLDGDAAKWAVFAQRGASGAGTGDVVGPASATSDSLAKFSGTTGKLLKDGAVIGTHVQAYSANLATFATKTFIDDDTMATASATAIPSSESVKAYADNLISSATTAVPDPDADYFIFEDATDSTQKKALVPFSTKYTSATPTILTTNLVLAENHSLSTAPSMITASLRCTDAGGDAGYVLNDELSLSSDDSPGYYSMTLWANSTQVGINISGILRAAHKSTNVTTNLTAAKWSVILKAWK